MFRFHKGDVAFEWILVATIGTLVFGAITYNISQTAGSLGNAVEDGIGAYAGAAPDTQLSAGPTPTPTPPFAVYSFVASDQDSGVMAFDTTVDGSGNIYMAGSFYGTADFDPGAGTYPLVGSTSYSQTFVVKLTSSGAFVWAKNIGGTNNVDFAEESYDLEVDASGNVYIAGSFKGTADFDPGPGTYNITQDGGVNNNGYLLKLNSSGDFVWAQKFTDVNQTPNMAISGSGNIYVSGNTSNQGSVYKYDSSGNLLWSKTLPTFAYADALAADGDSVILGGVFTDNSDFDLGAGTYTLMTGEPGKLSAYYVLKLNSSGDFVWAKSADPDGTNIYVSRDRFFLFADGSSNVYVTGEFERRGVPAVEPYANYGGDPIHLINTSIQFVWKMDSSGQNVFTKRFTGRVSPSGIATDGSGNIYIPGNLGNVSSLSYNFDPDGSGYPATPNNTDGYIVKLDASGNFSWAKFITGPGIAYANNIDFLPTGSIVTAGHIYSPDLSDFDPSGSTFNISATPGWADAYIWRVTSLQP